MTLTEALDYIYSFTNYEVRPEYRYAPDVIDPTRPANLLGLLGDPHRRCPVIHIAGTKGKGSVAAMCASALRAAGLRTGLYTSPHLQSFSERIQVDGCQIRDDELSDLVNEIRPAVARVEGVTTFEVITALAFLYFARCGAEAAVVEVGLGGRLDATNVVVPLASVITSLSYDHTQLLGHTLAEIAAEKGGIIKRGLPLVCAPQRVEALAVLEAIAAERQAPLTLVGRDWLYQVVQMTLDWQVVRVSRPGWPSVDYGMPLVGEHQAENATVALATLDIARGALPALTDQAIQRGLAEVDWPGRFQVLQKHPTIVLDGAHNVDSMDKLCRTLDTLLPNQRRLIVFGVAADKDVTEIVQVLAPSGARGDTIIVTAAHHPRAAEPADLAHQFAALGIPVQVAPDVSAALAQALAVAGPDDVICCTGSLFVVGDALTAWQSRLEPLRAPLRPMA